MVTLFPATDMGHGGNHRTYQLKYDIQEAIGGGSVTLVSFLEWKAAHKVENRHSGLISSFFQNVRKYIRRKRENPVRLIHDTGFSIMSFSDPNFLRYYEATLCEDELPAVCIIEHIGLAGVIAINRRHGVRTFACPQNIEALDGCSFENSRWALRSAMYDFANEVAVLSSCEERFMISRVESGFCEGLGYASQYYPYRPVGAITRRHEELRKRRCLRKGQSGLLLLLGTAGHKTTREGMLWFLNQCKISGLPDGVKIDVCGSKTDKLLSAGENISGIKIHGCVEQADLDDLLVQADAVLCPQRRGFGALTKLPELACAGIPVIVPRYVLYALDLPPGVHVVQDAWDSWIEVMQNIKEEASSENYKRWYERQQPTLAQAVRRVTEQT
ncbi:MAG: hypothetical protein PHR77_03640 [Kiritimatiellae bacterium]|nr:hypothetical protein [Kiritimatiellia bacterium]